MKSFLGLILILAVLTVASGCETVKGVGRDITGASDTVQNAMSKRK